MCFFNCWASHQKSLIISIMQGKFIPNSDVNTVLSPRPSHNLGLKTSPMLENLGGQPQQAKAKEVAPTKAAHERPHAVNETRPNLEGSANNNSNAPATK